MIYFSELDFVKLSEKSPGTPIIFQINKFINIGAKFHTPKCI